MRRRSLGIALALIGLAALPVVAQGLPGVLGEDEGVFASILGFFNRLNEDDLPMVIAVVGMIPVALLALLGTTLSARRRVAQLQEQLGNVRAAMAAQKAESLSLIQEAKEGSRQKSVRLSTLFLKLKNLVSVTEKGELMRELMTLLSKGFGATKCSFLMYDKRLDELFVMQSHGLPAAVMGKSVKIGENNMIGWVGKNLKLVTKDMVDRDNTLKGMDLSVPFPCLICAPVLVKDQLVGVLHIGERRDEEWSDVDSQLFWTSCLLSGIAFDKADLIEATRDELVSEQKVSKTRLEERKKMRGVLDKIVNPALAEELLTRPDELNFEGQMVEISVFFSDLKGFTSYSENRSPQEVVTILNEYLEAMTEVVFEHEGTLDKFVGDEIVAFWGALPKDPHHAKKAVRCGQKMREVLLQLQSKWAREGKEPLEMGMGIHTGTATFGCIGSSKKLDFTVIGDTVNLGARIEALTRHFNNDFIISEATYLKVKDIVQCKPLGSLNVKGKQKPVRVFEVQDVLMMD